MINLYYDSKDEKNKIYAYVWKPNGKIKGVVQIIHGMAEYAERYAPFAEYLNAQGFLVCADDHLGHGLTAKTKEDMGYFCDSRDYRVVLEDINELRLIIQKQVGNVPYFIMGHSMGSFFARNYIAKYGEEIAGAIIMGTGFKDKATLAAALGMVKLNAAFCGWRARPKQITKMAFGAYNKKFKPVSSPNAWISKNEENIKRYDNDPLCGFTFTNNGYYILFSVIKAACDDKTINAVPKDLPVLFVAGQDDPVGDYGKGVEKAYNKFKAAGVENAEIILYADNRHEILNDNCREQVQEDILCFLNKILNN